MRHDMWGKFIKQLWPSDIRMNWSPAKPVLTFVYTTSRNPFLMVVKYHVITRANLVGWTQFSDLSQRACVYFRLRPFAEKKHIMFAFVCLSMPECENVLERRK